MTGEGRGGGGTRSLKQVPSLHGGDLAAAEARFGIPREDWLDLSTGINPAPYPVGALPASCWTRLPGPDLALRQATAEHYTVEDPDCIVSAPGSQALIQLLPQLFPGKSVTVVAPTYGELVEIWEASHRVNAVADIGAVPGSSEIVVLANPNNPDGRRLAPERLWDLAQNLARRGGALVVDEAFADCDPELSLAPRIGVSGLLVLRSFGKFFGLAGLRLGFALAEPALAATIRRALGPWPVSGPALTIGRRALADRLWIEATRQSLAQQARALDAVLARSGLPVVGGCDLFRLVATDRAAALYDHLGRRGILVRIFPDHPRWLRIGLPGSGMVRLEAALSEFA